LARLIMYLEYFQKDPDHHSLIGNSTKAFF
jgi:hypothetical protein